MAKPSPASPTPEPESTQPKLSRTQRLAELAAEKPSLVVWTLAWPAVALNLLQTINSLLDAYFVNHLDRAALTALGSSTATIFLFFSFAFAAGIAPTALVARAFGAKNEEEVLAAHRKCFAFAASIGGGFMLLMIAFVPLAVRWFVPSDDLLAQSYTREYLNIFALCLPAAFVIQALAGSLRGIGDTKSPMILSGAQIVLHIIFNFLLIYPTRDVQWLGMEFTMPGAGLEIRGAAISLTASAWIAAIAYLLWTKRTPLGTPFPVRWPETDYLRRIFRITFAASLMSVVRVTSLMAFLAILRSVPNGGDAVAALRVGFSIEAIAFMPAFGLAIAGQTLVGQSLGMNKPDRAAMLGWNSAHWAGAVSAVMAVIMILFAVPMATLIIPEQPSVIPYAASYILYIASTEVLFAYGMVLTQAMLGAGDTKRPLIMTLVTMWAVRVPTAYICAIPLGMGAEGCWLAMAISQAVAGLAAMWLFKRGAWKLAKP